MLGRLLKSKSSTVTAAAVLLGVASLASRAVGVLRDRMLSGTFGAGAELDAYYAAFRIPDLVYNLFVLGAITAGFIPVLTRVLTRESHEEKLNESASRLTSLLLTVLGALLVVAAAAGAAAAPWLTRYIAPGFGGHVRELTVSLTRVMFLSPVLLGVSGVLGGVLQVRRRFLTYALAPILYNFGIIFGIVFLVPRLGVAGAAWGVVFGAAMHMAVQLLACLALGFRYRPIWDWRDAGLRDIWRLMVPRTAGLAVSQLNLAILTGVASTVGAGGIAVFNLANNLQSFPIGIISVSFAVAAFPLISELAAKDDRTGFVDAYAKTVRSVMFLIIPATVAFLLLRAQIVRVILGTGRFDWSDTIATADALAYFTLSLFAQALLPLVTRAFFAYHDVKTPLYAGIVAVVLERLLAAVLVARGMGTPGLALAFSVGSVFNLVVLWAFLRRRTGNLGEAAIMRPLAVMCVAGVAMALVIQLGKTVLGAVVNMQTFVGIFTQGAVAGALGIAAYIALALLLGSEDARRIVALYRRRGAPGPRSELGQEGEAIVAE